jgi:hypothetical protein
MPPHPQLFDIGELILARLKFVKAAREMSPGTERNQKRQIALSLKRLIDLQRKVAYAPLLFRRSTRRQVYRPFGF